MLAVCNLPSGSLTLWIYGTTCNMKSADFCNNSYSYCECRNIFPTPCGSLKLDVLGVNLNTSSLQLAPGWLQTIGINDIQSLQGRLDLATAYGSDAVTTWSINIFPKLEVITGGFNLYPATPKVVLLPGPGLGNLRAAGFVNIANMEGLQNTDLSFLSRLECVGNYINVKGMGTLTSFKGLERVGDATPVQANSYCVAFMTDTPTLLTNVSALATYVRCGPNQRSDNFYTDGRPCVMVSCGYLERWSALCDYVARGTCA